MSATVTYGGQTLATVENKTRVFETAGTYMEDDLTVTDVTSGGGASTTTVVFGEYSQPYANGFIIYVDGNGTVQKTLNLNAPTNIDMMSGSFLIVGDNMAFSLSGSFNYTYITGMTLVYDTSFAVGSRATLYYRVFQVD